MTASFSFLKLWSRLEIALAVILLAACGLQTGRMIHAMATTSLWTDEFGTLGTYYSKGPMRVLTDYRKAKNHIFFNLINSVLPGRESPNPARVRLLSLIAGATFALTLVAYAIWRRALFEGAVVLTLWTFAQQSLHLCLEGRGYGFLALGGLLSFIAVVEYFRTNKPGWLYAAGVVVVLGVYTLPGFLFYGGPLLLLTWLVKREKRPFFTGLAAGVAILLLYSPVARQLIAAFGEYGDQYGEDFKDPQSIVRALKLYLFAAPDTVAMIFLAVVALLPFATYRPLRLDGGAQGRMVVMAAALCFFAALLYLRTSPIRMANMGWVPFALAGILAGGAYLRTRPTVIRALCFGAIAAGLLVRIAPELRQFHFAPREDWNLAGQVAQKAFAPTVGIDYMRYGKYFVYTIDRPKKRSAPFDEQAYLDGRLIVVDAPNENPSEFSRGRLFFRPDGEPHNAYIMIPGDGRDILINFQIPRTTALDQPPSEITDRDTATGLSLQNRPVTLQTEPLPGGSSLVFLLNHDAKSENVIFGALDPQDKSSLAPEILRAGNSITFTIPGPPTEKRSYTILLSSQDAHIQLVEVWSTASP